MYKINIKIFASLIFAIALFGCQLKDDKGHIVVRNESSDYEILSIAVSSGKGFFTKWNCSLVDFESESFDSVKPNESRFIEVEPNTYRVQIICRKYSEELADRFFAEPVETPTFNRKEVRKGEFVYCHFDGNELYFE